MDILADRVFSRIACFECILRDGVYYSLKNLVSLIIEEEQIMHEVVIKYKNRKTLKALTALGEYLGFTISDPEKDEKNNVYHINGIPVESGDPKIDMKDLNAIFTGEDIDAKTLRESAWQRKM